MITIIPVENYECVSNKIKCVQRQRWLCLTLLGTYSSFRAETIVEKDSQITKSFTKTFFCFQGDQKGPLERKGLKNKIIRFNRLNRLDLLLNETEHDIFKKKLFLV